MLRSSFGTTAGGKHVAAVAELSEEALGS